LMGAAEPRRENAWANCVDLFDAIDNPLRRIPGGERGERSLMCASVPWETDRLVSRLVSNPSFG
jgi:hypothetical protein